MKQIQNDIVNDLVEHWMCEADRFPQGFTRKWAKQKLMLMGQFPNTAEFEVIYCKTLERVRPLL